MASIGEQLRQAREAENLSLEDISNEIKISKRYLEALEENNYSVFPAQVYARGFLSAYAKCVGLDPRAILEQYNKITLLEDGETDSVAPKRTTRRMVRRRVVMLLIALLFALLCLFGLIWVRGKYGF